MIASFAKTARQEAAVDSFRAAICPTKMTIADLGCSVGPNVLQMASEIIEAIAQASHQLNRRPPEMQVFLNDLPGNDFNTLFSLLPEFYELRETKLQETDQEQVPCFISGVPGSFYVRLFVSKSLHFVYSSNSLHWLSQVPQMQLQDGSEAPLNNKGNVYISHTSPPSVFEAYKKQFKRDFSLFLKCRGEEVVEGGHMVLTFMARRSSDPLAPMDFDGWELLAKALRDMVSLGLTEEEKVDSFNLPWYAPSMEEVKDEITIQGSFAIKKIELFDINWDDNSQEAPRNDHNYNPVAKSTLTMAKASRAVLESMLKSHFGEAIIEKLFERYCFLLEEYYSKYKAEVTNILIVFERK
ncbi:Salicylate carboxymethyltransferase [Ananas comosus]|uniref:Salicylate carboxymethyltransferase n=1 Tax=Ananas comosus TaxID=4615 RepID=A0A199W4T6_ANACO|nr:Salicylate carboxymethyltransferase [Ananas comosus]